MPDTIANDRYLRTPISLADLMPDAYGDYTNSLPIVNPKGSIRLDKNLYNNPEYLQNISDNLEQKVNLDPNDVLRHEILHAGQDKYKVNPFTVEAPENELNNLIRHSINKHFGSQEWITHSLQSKKGEYLHNSRNSIMGQGNTTEYQKYLIKAIMNSSQIHPGFKALLQKMGYKEN